MKKFPFFVLLFLSLCFLAPQKLSAQAPLFLSELSYVNTRTVTIGLGVPKNTVYNGYRLVIAVEKADQLTHVPYQSQQVSTIPNISSDPAYREICLSMNFNGVFDLLDDLDVLAADTKITIAVLNPTPNNSVVFAWHVSAGIPSTYTYGSSISMGLGIFDDDVTNNPPATNSVQLTTCTINCTPIYTLQVGGVGIQCYFKPQTTPVNCNALNSVLLTAINSAIVLPVDFLSISAKNINGTNHISWITASEKNNSHFVVEKLQNDNYVPLGQVKGFGNSQVARNYTFEDNNPSGISYYRVSSFDYGLTKIANSVTVSVECTKCTLNRKYWVTDNTLMTNGESEQISIIDIAGRNVYRGNYYNGIVLGSGVYIVNGHKVVSIK